MLSSRVGHLLTMLIQTGKEMHVTFLRPTEPGLDVSE